MGKRSRLQRRKNREIVRRWEKLKSSTAGGYVNATTLPMSEWRTLDLADWFMPKVNVAWDPGMKPYSVTYVGLKLVSESLVYRRGAIVKVQEWSHEFSYQPGCVKLEAK